METEAQLIKKGNDLMKTGELRRALEIFQAAVSLDSAVGGKMDYNTTFEELGNRALEQNEFWVAERAFEKINKKIEKDKWKSIGNKLLYSGELAKAAEIFGHKSRDESKLLEIGKRALNPPSPDYRLALYTFRGLAQYSKKDKVFGSPLPNLRKIMYEQYIVKIGKLMLEKAKNGDKTDFYDMKTAFEETKNQERCLHDEKGFGCQTR